MVSKMQTFVVDSVHEILEFVDHFLEGRHDYVSAGRLETSKRFKLMYEDID